MRHAVALIIAVSIALGQSPSFEVASVKLAMPGETGGRIQFLPGGRFVVTIFSAEGKFAGTIPAPQGTHGTFFGGRDKKTLFGIVFYGAWGTPSARNRIIAIPTIAQGYTWRAK